MFRRRKSLHVGTDFGNDTDCSKITADTRSGLKNGKFLLIGSGERKNEFFKLCFPGFEVFIMSFNYFEFTSLFGKMCIRDRACRKPLMFRKLYYVQYFSMLSLFPTGSHL